MKYFCSKCGKTTQYNFELPKFCSFCGQSFASKSVSVEADDKRTKFLNELKLKKNINSINIEEDILYNSEDVEQGNYKVHDFKKIKPSFKIDIYQPKGESFGSLIDNPSQKIDFVQDSTPNEKRTKEQILKDFQKEAGLSRNQE
jgi:hypothetical protein